MSSQNHLLPNQHDRLVVCWPRPIPLQPLADRNLGPANILQHGPHDGQTRRFGRTGIDLIGALAHIAKQAFKRVGTADGAVHDRREGIKRQHMLLIFAEAAHRFRHTLEAAIPVLVVVSLLLGWFAVTRWRNTQGNGPALFTYVSQPGEVAAATPEVIAEQTEVQLFTE